MGTVMHFHPQVTVIIIFFIIAVLAVIFFFYLYIFILGRGRRKIYIIRSLTGFVSGSATAESCCG